MGRAARNSRRRAPERAAQAWTLVALVGEQPAAIAAAIKTWAVNVGTPRETLLLATAHVAKQKVTDRLRSFLAKLGITPTIRAISTTTTPDDGASSIVEVGGELTARKDTAIALYVDPGLKFLVAALAQRLGPSATFLHADTRELLWIDRSGRREVSGRYALEDVGLPELLALYDLTAATDTALPDALGRALRDVKRPSDVRIGLTLSGGAEPVRFDLAREHNGWLLALNWTPDKETVRQSQRVSNLLNGLRPLVSVCASRVPDRERARAAGLQVVEPTRHSLAGWMKNAVKGPGHDVIEEPASSSSITDRGRGGKGPPLVAWIGTDPSSTLQAIYTFKPRRAWLPYDSTTPMARRAMQRLRAQASSLPCGPIQFVPSDLVGRGVKSKLARAILYAPGVVADVSPGTNGQAAALALLPGVRLWSHRSKEGRAEPLDGGPGPVPLVAADALVQARLRGGRLRGQPLDAWAWDLGTIRRLTAFARDVAPLVARRPDSARSTMVGCARKSRPPIEFDTVDGLFRRIVAALFVEAGADEVLVNIEWDWRQPPAAPGGAFRDRIDLLVRWRLRYLAVSCTLAAPKSFSLEREAVRTEAVARDGVARLAIPILVRPALDPGVIQRRLSERRGAVYLDLATIAPVGSLSPLVEQIAAARSTT